MVPARRASHHPAVEVTLPVDGREDLDYFGLLIELALTIDPSGSSLTSLLHNVRESPMAAPHSWATAPPRALFAGVDAVDDVIRTAYNGTAVNLARVALRTAGVRQRRGTTSWRFLHHTSTGLVSQSHWQLCQCVDCCCKSA